MEIFKYLFVGYAPLGILIITLMALVLWIRAEFKCDVKVRLIYGISSLLLCITVFEGVRLYGRGYERLYIRNCLRTIKDQIKAGNSQQVIDAISKFETNEQSHDFSYAASRLWDDCSARDNNQAKKKTSNKEDAPAQKPGR